MKLEEFIDKNNVTLSDEVLSGCRQAIKIMEKSRDPLHDQHHIYRLLDNLDKFLNSTKELIAQDVNYDVLLLAICWHDTWRASKFPTNLFVLIYHTFWEGIGSSRLFSSKIKKFNINNQIVNQVKHSIKKHSRIQFVKTNSIEAKILWDLDRLEEWGLARLEALKKKFLSNNLPPNPKFFKIGLFYFKKFMLNIPDTIMNFQWPRRQYQKRKKTFLQYVKSELYEHQQLFDKTDSKKIFTILSHPEKVKIRV